MRAMLCSVSVPWPGKPLLGIFHVHQADAVAKLGGHVELFSPAPAIPRLLGHASRRARAHLARPDRYEFDGITVHSPRVAFSFPFLRHRRVTLERPEVIDRWARAAMARPLERLARDMKPDVLLAHGMQPWAGAVAQVADSLGIPHAYIEHSAQTLETVEPGSRLHRFTSAAAERAARTFVVGPAMQEYATERLGWPRVSLLPNGALRREGTPPARPQALEGRRIILAAANYYRRKGFEELVDAYAGAAARLPRDIDLHLVTGAPAELRERIASSGVAERIVVHEPMQPRELLDWMAWSELFALPSWEEAFGLVYAEALAAGTPVLASTDCGFVGFAERWEQERGAPACYVVPPRDVAALGEALVESFADDADREQRAAEGAALVDAKFSWPGNARQLMTELGFPPGEASSAADSGSVPTAAIRS